MAVTAQAPKAVSALIAPPTPVPAEKDICVIAGTIFSRITL